MTETKNIGELKEYIKDLPDYMPIYLDDEHDCMSVLSIKTSTVAIYNVDLDDDVHLEALVLGVA